MAEAVRGRFTSRWSGGIFSRAQRSTARLLPVAASGAGGWCRRTAGPMPPRRGAACRASTSCGWTGAPGRIPRAHADRRPARTVACSGSPTSRRIPGSCTRCGGTAGGRRRVHRGLAAIDVPGRKNRNVTIVAERCLDPSVFATSTAPASPGIPRTCPCPRRRRGRPGLHCATSAKLAAGRTAWLRRHVCVTERWWPCWPAGSGCSRLCHEAAAVQDKWPVRVRWACPQAPAGPSTMMGS